MTMDDFDFYLISQGFLTYVAGRSPIAADEVTFGLHPDCEQAAAGEVAVLDWSQAGGPILAEAEYAAGAFLDRIGAVRSMGAALAAVERHPADHDSDLRRLAEMAREIELAALTGGPLDPHLRLGLAARVAALYLMGVTGEVRGTDRPEGYGRLDGRTQETLTLIGMMPQTDPDREAEREAQAERSIMQVALAISAQKARRFWQPEGR